MESLSEEHKSESQPTKSKTHRNKSPKFELEVLYENLKIEKKNNFALKKRERELLSQNKVLEAEFQKKKSSNEFRGDLKFQNLQIESLRRELKAAEKEKYFLGKENERLRMALKQKETELQECRKISKHRELEEYVDAYMKSINQKNYEIHGLSLQLRKYQQLYEEEYSSSQRAYEEIIELHRKILDLEEHA